MAPWKGIGWPRLRRARGVWAAAPLSRRSAAARARERGSRGRARELPAHHLHPENLRSGTTSQSVTTIETQRLHPARVTALLWGGAGAPGLGQHYALLAALTRSRRSASEVRPPAS